VEGAYTSRDMEERVERRVLVFNANCHSYCTNYAEAGVKIGEGLTLVYTREVTDLEILEYLNTLFNMLRRTGGSLPLSLWVTNNLMSLGWDPLYYALRGREEELERLKRMREELAGRYGDLIKDMQEEYDRLVWEGVGRDEIMRRMIEEFPDVPRDDVLRITLYFCMVPVTCPLLVVDSVSGG